MRELSKKHVKIFKQEGLLIVDDYISQDSCKSIIADIEKFHDNGKLISVNFERGIGCFKTLNGKDLIQCSQLCLELRDQVLKLIKRYLDDKIVNISNMKIGLSANRLTVGGSFKKHYYRNKITAVIYLNECIKEGEMICHPRSRFLLPGRYLFGLRRLQGFLDRIVLTPFYQKYLAKKFVITPKQGRIVIFEGNKTLHGVQPIHQNSSIRYTIQLAYDEHENLFETKKVLDYYGNK